MNSEALISVIVPVYNCEEFLVKCFKSLSLQTHQNIEIIAVNDGSTDCSGKILDEISKKDSRVTVYHRSNEGVSSARNFGINRAKGEFIALQDADDYSSADRLEKQLQYIEENNLDICGCAMRNFGEGGGKISRYPSHDNKIKYNLLFHGRVMAGPTPLMKASKISGVTFRDGEKMAEDYSFFLGCFLLKDIVFGNIQEPLYFYRRSDKQASSILKSTAKDSVISAQKYRMSQAGYDVSLSVLSSHYDAFKRYSHINVCYDSYQELLYFLCKRIGFNGNAISILKFLYTSMMQNRVKEKAKILRALGYNRFDIFKTYFH